MACCTAMSSVQAENWRLGASAGITETYTNNVFFAPQGQASAIWLLH